MTLSRRGLLGAFLAAPAIIRTPGLLMPVKRIVVPELRVGMVITGPGILPGARVISIISGSAVINWTPILREQQILRIVSRGAGGGGGGTP